MEYIKRNVLVIALLALTGWNTMQIDEVRGVAYNTLGATYNCTYSVTFGVPGAFAKTREYVVGDVPNGHARTTRTRHRRADRTIGGIADAPTLARALRRRPHGRAGRAAVVVSHVRRPRLSVAFGGGG